ncbi:hypothetical protein MMC10_003514 [Thelotrema lepadinum]|nr:hypothetical protein [Thelotrema lepadinum]
MDGIPPHRLQEREPIQDEVVLEHFWPVQSLNQPLSEAAGQLCASCARIDFEFLIRNALWVRFQDHSEIHSEFPLGWLKSIRDRHQCNFCRLIQNVLSIYWSHKQTDEVWRTCKINGRSVHCQLVNHSEQVDYSGSSRYIFFDKALDGTIYWIMKKGIDADFYHFVEKTPAKELATTHARVYYFEVLTRPDFHDTADRFDNAADDLENNNPRVKLRQSPKIQAILNDEAIASQGLVPGGRTMSPQIDTSLLRNWILRCKNKHDTVLRPGVMSDLRVIDVVDECIVHLKTLSRYVALSYVWGGSQSLVLTNANWASLSCIGALTSGTIPSRTIRDATDLTKKLRERYL